VLQPKIAKKNLKTCYFYLMVIQGHWCYYPWKGRQHCLLW